MYMYMNFLRQDVIVAAACMPDWLQEKTSREAEAITWDLGAARAATPSTAAVAPGGGDGDGGGDGGGSDGPGGAISASGFGDDLFAGDAAAVLQQTAGQQENKK